jgi:3',5'-cyclic AMP phosphodiesterase CpdA
MSVAADASGPVRLAHLSDVHVPAARVGWRLRDWLTKRSTGWLHLRLLGRGRRFRQTEAVLAALARDLRQHQPDRVVFCGDASTLGFPEEFIRAAQLLGAAGNEPLPGLAVPGNHDYYTPADAGSGAFERSFAPWQQGERQDGSIYPFAQRAGSVWLVGVNSSVGHRLPWDASGWVGAPQLERLAALLERLAPGPRILVTHYPICLAGGGPEARHHGLRDLDELLRITVKGNVCLWLHGHRHTPYHLGPGPGLPIPVICSGSATEQGRWSYGLYTLQGRRLHAVRRTYSPARQAFEDAEQFDLELPAGESTAQNVR